ncbi:MAG TPA: Rieske (2Fe-2S) protein [Ktedonosporobacter sp.]|nr:Rieske (2Fe-2S) protein [Ktedonosporobacter sp.]
METLIRSHHKVLYNLGSIERIPPGEGRTFRVEHILVSVFRTRGGAVLATQSDCPHTGEALADGIVSGEKVICPLHSYKFDLRTGNPIDNTCEALKTYAVSLNACGDILLDLEG